MQQRRVAILAALVALGSLVVLIATKLNPESRPEMARQDQRVTILERTFMAMEHVLLLAKVLLMMFVPDGA